MITCWLYRNAILRSLDEHRPMSEAARRHLRQCARCTRLWQPQAEAAVWLSAGAVPEQAVSPGLRRKIMASVARADRPGRERKVFPGFGPALAGAAACVVLALALARRPAPAPSRSAGGDGSSRPIPNSAGASDIANFPYQAQVRHWAENLNPDQPLAHEMQLVWNDARTAADSLANSFLPANLRVSMTGRSAK